MTPAEFPASVREQLLRRLDLVTLRRLPPGMSGASVFRCDLKSGETCLLRQWPEGTKLERVAEIQRVADHAKRNGCDLVPRVVEVDRPPTAPRLLDGRIWQIWEWMPGSPLDADADLDHVRMGAAAIAAFHRSVEQLDRDHPNHGTHRVPPPAICDRIDRVHWLDRNLGQVLHAPLAVFAKFPDPLGESLFAACQLLNWKWPEIGPSIRRNLAGFEGFPMRRQFVLRDIHRDNALFQSGRATGLVDLDAIRIDTPWIDLARWAGSFTVGRNDLRPVWQAAMAGFCGQHSFNNSPEMTSQMASEMDFGQRFAEALCNATTWISLANWLVWLVAERREFDASLERLAGRIDELRILASRAA